MGKARHSHLLTVVCRSSLVPEGEGRPSGVDSGIRLGEDETLIVKQHNREGMIQPRLGEQVTLGWDPNNSVSLKPQ